MEPEEIKSDLLVEDVLKRWPECIPIFLRHNMKCVGCDMSRFETISNAAEIYQLPVDLLLEELRSARAE